MSKKIFKKWTDREIELLKQNSNKSKPELQQLFPDRSIKSVIHKITNMNLPRIKEYTRFSEMEDEILIKNSMLPKQKIVELLPQRDWESIRQRMKLLNLDRQKKWEYWTDEELSLLKNANSLEDALKKLPKRNESKIRSMTAKLRISFDNKTWTENEVGYLIENYNKLAVFEIAETLSRSIISIYQKASKMNLISYRNSHVELTYRLVKTVLEEEKELEEIQEEFPYLYNNVIEDLSILRMYEEGHPSTYISKELNYSIKTIIRKLNIYGVEIRSSGYYISDKKEEWKKYGKFLRRLRGTTEYRNWRKEVLNRDCYTCQCCQKSKNIDLEVHHIHNFASNEELRFSVENGIVLCKECHIEFHTTYGYRDNDQLQLDDFTSKKFQIAL